MGTGFFVMRQKHIKPSGGNPLGFVQITRLRYK